MNTMTRTGLIALTLAVPLAAAAALSGNSPAKGAQMLPQGLQTVQGDMMGQGGMMDQDRMGDMMGQRGMGGMMNMMQQMSEMMESCNQMMQAMMDGEDGQRPNGQGRDRNPDRESPQQ